jgi:N utilization substance protein A
MHPATVAILEEGGYRTLNDIIDLEREDFVRLPGISADDAERLMSIIDELTEDGTPDEELLADADAGAGGKSGGAIEGSG